MQKAHLYEAILFVNRGVGEAVRGLERLKRAKNSDLDPAYFDERFVLFEDRRAWLNAYFCNNIQSFEYQDAARFEKTYREYENDAFDEVQVYRDVQVLEERRRLKEKPLRVRIYTPEEQQEWERQYPRPPGDAEGDAHFSKGEQA